MRAKPRLHRRLRWAALVALALALAVIVGRRTLSATTCEWIVVGYYFNWDTYQEEPIWEYYCWEDPPPPDDPPPPPPEDPPPPPPPPPPEPPSCSYSVSPSGASVDSGNGVVYFEVQTQDGCGWAASGASNFLTLVDWSGGSGPGWVGYAYENNTSTEGRSTSVGIADQTIPVSQAGAPASPPPPPPPPPSGGGGSFGMNVSFFVDSGTNDAGTTLSIVETGLDGSWGCGHWSYWSRLSIFGPNGAWGLQGAGFSLGTDIENVGGEYDIISNLDFYCDCAQGWGGADSTTVIVTDAPENQQGATVTLSPSGTHTVSQNSGDVIITATVTPPEQTGSLTWSADRGSRVDQTHWRVPTTTAGSATVTARVGSARATTVVIVEAAQQCAVPRSFRKLQARDDGGTLSVAYIWESTGGPVSTLSQCRVGERADYNPSDIPFPMPFPLLAPPNPTEIEVPGDRGFLEDNHQTPGNFRTPYSARTFTATQIYRYSCPCSNGGAWTTLMGPLWIDRTVEQVDGAWRFRITKDGDSAVRSLP